MSSTELSKISENSENNKEPTALNAESNNKPSIETSNFEKDIIEAFKQSREVK